MRRLGAVMVVATAACNALFGIESTRLLEPADTDEDTVPDDADNCIAVANLDQADEDRDSLGDACDSCPLFVDVDDSDVGDGDGVGDACDPRPATVGDCLVLFDSMLDPDAFWLHWELIAGEAESFLPEEGAVNVAAASGQQAVLARGEDGSQLSGVLSVQVRGAYPRDSAGSLTLLAGTTGPATAVGRCVLYGAAMGVDGLFAFPHPMSGGNTGSAGLSSDSIDDEITMRLTAAPELACRAEHGLAIGAARSNRPVPAGQAGFSGSAVALRIDAVAIYAIADPCPEPLRR